MYFKTNVIKPIYSLIGHISVAKLARPENGALALNVEEASSTIALLKPH